MARKYGPGEAWAYVEFGADTFGDSEDELLVAPTRYGSWDRFVDAAYTEARAAGATFPKQELARELWDYWFQMYEMVGESIRAGHYGPPRSADRRKANKEYRALTTVYDSWAEGTTLGRD